VVGDTLVAGVFTFSRTNVTAGSAPWAVDYGNRALFNQVDVSGDGLLSRDELVAAAHVLNMTPEEAGLFFDSVDVDGSGTLDKREIETHEAFPFGKSWIPGYHYDIVRGQVSVTSSWAKCAADIALVAALDPKAKSQDNLRKAEGVLGLLDKGEGVNTQKDRRLGHSRHSRHTRRRLEPDYETFEAVLELELELENWEGQPWLGKDFSGSAFGSGCAECAAVSTQVTGLQIVSLLLVVPMIYKTFARSDADDDGVCTKVVGLLARRAYTPCILFVCCVSNYSSLCT
jgi:hypothetical protein